MVPFPLLLQRARMQHLFSINPCVGRAAAELFWMHFPGGSLQYVPHLSKEILVKEKAKRKVERKNLKTKPWERQWNWSCPAAREKDGKCPKGMC